MRAGHLAPLTHSSMENEKQPIQATTPDKRYAGLRPVQKGQVLNPNGKKPGTLNRITQETRELLAHAAKQNLPAVNHAIDALLKSNNEIVKSRGVELYLRLLSYSVPVLSAMAVKAEGTSTGIVVIGKPADLELPVLEEAIVDDSNKLNDDTNE